MNRIDADFLVLGGGLQGALMALALRALQPRARVHLVERRPDLGAEQVWSAHQSDLLPRDLAWVSPLFTHRWPGYDLNFPGLRRRVDLPYATIEASTLRKTVRAAFADAPHCALILGVEAQPRGAHEVRLADGRVLRAPWVLDARGDHAPAEREGGYQKFVGLQLELSEPHGLERPILMDACVDQRDGFRFFYVLPLGPERLLVEDTRFHDRPDLDREQMRREILAYAEGRGWKPRATLGEECGVLPMPWRDRAPDVHELPLRIGMRGGWFHPGTGFSFPSAARLAGTFASARDERERGEGLLALAAEHEAQARYARGLNRLLFRWYPPHARIHIFERFQRLPAETIARFYALRTTATDRARILVGRPPRGLSLLHRWKGAA